MLFSSSLLSTVFPVSTLFDVETGLIINYLMGNFAVIQNDAQDFTDLIAVPSFSR